MSRLNPSLSTMRSTARSSRFLGNAYAGTNQPRSRSRSERSKTVKLVTSLSAKAKTGIALPSLAQEVIILCHHLIAGAGEVEREGGHLTPQVIHREDQLVR